ncbi:MAG: hypothetical protein IH946_09515, partial [Bacteroidetes bacterium]|nr:hypothetical protein [Bacteroidota bacterium]
MIPYEGFETLIFTNISADTLIFQSHDRDSYYTLDGDPEHVPTCKDPGNSYTLENDTINFYLDNTKWIVLELSVRIGTLTDLMITIYGTSFTLDAISNPNVDTIIINGIQYDNVHHAVKTDGRELYYSKEHGVLSYALKDNI